MPGRSLLIAPAVGKPWRIAPADAAAIYAAFLNASAVRRYVAEFALVSLPERPRAQGINDDHLGATRPANANLADAPRPEIVAAGAVRRVAGVWACANERRSGTARYRAHGARHLLPRDWRHNEETQ
jgi:hypothetical protein